MQKTSLFVLAAIFGIAQAGFVLGTCDKPDLQSDFDIVPYTGLWYEVARDKDFFWEQGGSCATAEYTLNDDGTLKIFNS